MLRIGNATLKFDPSILNTYSVSAVTWSNSIPNSSKNKQFAAEL